MNRQTINQSEKLYNLQTILGAGGAIGIPLAKELLHFTNHIRLVSRNPVAVNPGDHLMKADISDPAQLDRAIAGSTIVYLVVGFEYNTQAWKEKWPTLMRNVIESCKKHKAKLIFFDNVYMYDRYSMQSMTEDTPIKPSSKKGAVRAEIANMVQSEWEQGNLHAIIARCADFMGPKNSVLTEMVYKNLSKGKKADWIADVNKIHSFTFTHDAAKATALLGNSQNAFNQVWHLPTSSEKITGKRWIQLFAEEMQVKPKHRVLPIWMMGLMGIFIPVLKEFKEMAYQYDRDYFFDSSKFNKQFSFEPTAPKDAVRAIINELKG